MNFEEFHRYRVGKKLLSPKNQDYASLVEVFGDALDTGAEVFLREGDYALGDNTLTLSGYDGLVVHTENVPQQFDNSRGVRISHTGSGPALTLDNCRNCTFGPLRIYGDGGNAAGVRIVNTGNLGSGAIRFENLYIRNTINGIETGVLGGNESNNDQIIVDWLDLFQTTGYGWVTYGDQQLLNIVKYFYATQCAELFYAKRGGSFRIMAGGTTECGAIIRNGLGGPNAMLNIIQGVRTETQNLWMDCDTDVGSGYNQIHNLFLGCEQATPPSDTDPCIKVSPGNVAILHGCWIKSKVAGYVGAAVGGINKAFIKLQDCRLQRNPNENTPSNSDFQFKSRDCADSVGVLWSDYLP